MKNVNTVCGPVRSDELGIVLPHEHIVFGFPGWNGDCTVGPFGTDAWVERILAELERAKKAGVKTIVDATPNECARNPQFLKKISQMSGINIICATGCYFEDFSCPSYWKNREFMGSSMFDELYEMMITEITEGIADTGIKPGVIKLATSSGRITDFERVLFEVAAKVHGETGIPIITHTQDATMGAEQAELLVRSGVDPKKIQIGHMCDSLDLEYHERVLSYGVNDAFDRIGHNGLSGTPYITDVHETIYKLLEKGYEDQIVLAHDCVIVEAGRDVYRDEAHEAMFDMIHMDTVGTITVPALKEMGAADRQIDKMLIGNPARFFG